MKYLLSALILVFLLSGCGGGGKKVDPNIVAYCVDGTNEYSTDCKNLCVGHGGVNNWGLRGQHCANNPP